MLFNSPEYLLLFLPLSLILYFSLNRYHLTLASKSCLIISSLVFYAWWNPLYIPLIVGSILFNYVVGSCLIQLVTRSSSAPSIFSLKLSKKTLLLLGICGNLLLLTIFKYTDFLISNLNYLAGWQIKLLHITLPLGISFFSFTQIAYLVDSYRGLVAEYSFSNYCLFVTFFPHLLAGPIIHHKEMMPQFDLLRNKPLNYRNICMGLFLLLIGLFKKVCVADIFAGYANYGYSHTAILSLVDAWVTSLSYTFQLYFDFSGYTDMAIGSSLMFNIRLPVNFNSPYKSLDIQEFWKRWHITLSRFMRDYIYIPLGGNRCSENRTLGNLLLTFLIGGIWHGAGWTFVLWGLLHGAAMMVHRVWQRHGLHMPTLLAWFVTFNFVNVAWVFFRAKSVGEALQVLHAMFDLRRLILPGRLESKLAFLSSLGLHFGRINLNTASIPMIVIFMIVCLVFKNSDQMIEDFRPDARHAAMAVSMATLTLLSMSKVSEFIYFNF